MKGKTKDYEDFSVLKYLIDSWKILKARSNKSDIDKKLIAILGEEFAQTFDFDESLMNDLQGLFVPQEKKEPTNFGSKIDTLKVPFTEEEENLEENVEKKKVKSTKFINSMRDNIT